MYTIVIFNWYNWLLTIQWSCFFFLWQMTCFISNSHLLGWVMAWQNMCVFMYRCMSARVACIMFRHFSVMYSDIKETSNLLNWISKAGLRVVYDHTSSNFIRNVTVIYTEWHKKTETFEKPNKNWRNPRKKIYWQKLNHYNLPFKRK